MSAIEVPRLRSEDIHGIGVLLVTPNNSLRAELRNKLQGPRWALTEVSSGAEALEHLHERSGELLLLDPSLPDLEVTEFSGMVRDQFPGVQIISVNPQTGTLVLGTSSPTSIASRLTEAVYGTAVSQTVVRAPAEVHVMRASAERRRGLRGLVGESTAMLRIYEHVHMVAVRDSTVLVTGESGTGKDLIAQSIHGLSSREKQPLVTINCAAIPEALLEAELFGYTKGSFTGAVQSRIGRIHAAHGGTLFLDEIGDMPLALQSKILRFLEQGEVQRIGGNDNLKVNVRVVAATNGDLESLVKQRLFREDLYFRLAVFPIKLPPLRERFGDVRRLAESFLNKFAPGVRFSLRAMEALEAHHWPGNVRELRNVIERASILAGDEHEIHECHIVL